MGIVKSITLLLLPPMLLASVLLCLLYVQQLPAPEALSEPVLSVHSAVKFVWIALLLSIVMATVGGIWFAFKTQKRVKAVMENAVRLANDAPLRAPLAGRDEIAQLDALFRKTSVALEASMKTTRALISNSTDVICCIRSDFTFADISAAADVVWGDKPFQLVGSPMSIIVVPQDLPALQESMQNARETGTTTQRDVRIKREGDATAWMRWSVNWVLQDQSYYCVVHDVTEERELEDLKREFIGMVSHDLRTPLMSVKAFLEMLLYESYGTLSEKGHARRLSTNDSVNRMIALINDLLDMQCLDAGRLELTVENVPVSLIAEKSQGAVRDIAEQNNISLNLEILQDFDVHADLDRLVQVLVNLIGNAVKFSESGRSVKLRVLRTGASARFEVIDEGRGISEEHLEKIFDRYYQTSKDDAKQQKGSGLGLAIAKEIVRLHQGDIGVESKLGSGSIFWFTIPAVVDTQSVNDAESPSLQVNSR